MWEVIFCLSTDDDDGVSNQIKTLATEYKLSLHRPKRRASTAA